MAESGRKICHVELDEDERRFLREIVDGGKGSAERRKRAHVLLLADRGRADGGRTDVAQARPAGHLGKRHASVLIAAGKRLDLAIALVLIDEAVEPVP